MTRVAGKVAIITGAASGLGYAAAVKLMSEGAKVMLSDINEDVINTMPERLKDFSKTQFSTFVHDVTNENSWIDLIEKTETEFGQINILVNSAGISLGADVVSTEFEIWKKVHQVNLDSVFLGCKYVIPKMSKSGQGSIINISSISGIVADGIPLPTTLQKLVYVYLVNQSHFIVQKKVTMYVVILFTLHLLIRQFLILLNRLSERMKQ